MKSIVEIWWKGLFGLLPPFPILLLWLTWLTPVPNATHLPHWERDTAFSRLFSSNWVLQSRLPLCFICFGHWLRESTLLCIKWKIQTLEHLWVFSWHLVRVLMIGSSSSNFFEWSTSTRKELSSLLICFDVTKFVWLRDVSLVLERWFAHVFWKLKLKCAKSPIPVDVGHSNKFWDTCIY